MPDIDRLSSFLAALSDRTDPVAAVEQAQAELDRLLASLSNDGEERDLSPVYLVVSNRRGLIDRYGPNGFSALEADLDGLRSAVEGRLDAPAGAVYVDDAGSLAPYRLDPVDPGDPAQVKMLIDRIDAQLAERGQCIRYLLIVGGDSVVPFYRLPNPLDDQDLDVPSDNPYGARGDDYLVPERAVGRLPDAERGGLTLLRDQIETAVAAHHRATRAKGLLDSLRGALWPAREPRDGAGLGYSASIWRKASQAVFETIGVGRHLRISPPLTSDDFKVAAPVRLSYFNLHGIADGPNWYGQRDALFAADYPLFPVALRPDDLTADVYANSVVLSEACYGANVAGKDARGSIALRFLALGALAVVGSTNISYGSITPPLLGADLIGRYFWEGLRAHMAPGDALRHARAGLVREMEQRQGYLDAEDQKTLIGFVLLGDPALPIAALHGVDLPDETGSASCPPLICGRRTQAAKAPVPDSVLAAVQERVEASLPHMARARVSANSLLLCSGQCDRRCKSRAGQTGNWSLTLAKDIPANGDGAHRQVVRVTVDERGRVLKLTVSK